MKWIDLKGPILADTVYADGQLVAKDVVITLPSVTPMTAEFRAMGTLELPMIGQIEPMEATITKVGIDLGLLAIVKLQKTALEFRWVQDVLQSDGNTKREGCKAFVNCVPKGIPGLSLEPGAMSENEVTAAVMRYQLFVGGEEYWLIDRLNMIMRVGGTDYCKELGSLL